MTEPVKHTAIQEEKCDQAPELADFLGHDKTGHLIFNRMLEWGITTISQLREQSDRNIKDMDNLGLGALARIRELVPEPLGESMSKPISTERVREIVLALNEYQQGDGYRVYDEVAALLPEFSVEFSEEHFADARDEFALTDHTYVKENDEGWWHAYRFGSGDLSDTTVWRIDPQGTIYVLRGKGWKLATESLEIPAWDMDDSGRAIRWDGTKWKEEK